MNEIFCRNLALKLSELSNDELNEKIKNIIHRKALEMGFICESDRLSNNKKYRDFKVDLKNHIDGLSFLSTVIYDKYSFDDIDMVMKYINDRVEATIKGMANNRMKSCK